MQRETETRGEKSLVLSEPQLPESQLPQGPTELCPSWVGSKRQQMSFYKLDNCHLPLRVLANSRIAAILFYMARGRSRVAPEWQEGKNPQKGQTEEVLTKKWARP